MKNSNGRTPIIGWINTSNDLKIVQKCITLCAFISGLTLRLFMQSHLKGMIFFSESFFCKVKG